MKKCMFFLIAAVCFTFIIAGMNIEAQQKLPSQQIQTQKVIKKPVLIALPMIKQIVPFYDDCQLIFYVKGNFFGTTQGTRIIRMKSHTQMYTPQILKWTPTQIDCLLKGNFELGRKYNVYLWNTATHKIVSNQYNWLVKTKLNPFHQGFSPGQVIAVSGCLLGHAQGARKLIIGKTEAQVTQWTCEDIIFRVPNLRPGVYPLFLREGRLILSNKIKIQIL
jgi:hypothetical protein